MDRESVDSVRWSPRPRVDRAIVVVDMVESVRLMLADEDSVIERWSRFVHEASAEVLPAFHGRMVKSLGDGLLLDFNGAREALFCARALLQRMAALNAKATAREPIRLRFGIHAAPVVVETFDILGNAVNLTARIAALAGLDQIVATSAAVDQIADGLDAALQDLGECYLKHIPEPQRVWRLLPPAPTQPVRALQARDAAAARSADAPRPRVAVLTLDADASAPVLGAMIADELAGQLAAHRTLELISRMSTRLVQPFDPRDLLHRVGAHYALGGSCAAVGDRLVLTLELSFVAEDRVVWSRVLTTGMGQIVSAPADVLSEVGPAILEAIQVNETGRARSLPLASLDSYALLVGGLRLMYRLSRSDFVRAREVLDEIVVRHPRHPDGYAWLAKWHILQLHQGWSDDPGRSAGMARDMARRALDRDDRNSVALVVTGMVLTYNDRRLDAAEQAYDRALHEHPNDALAWLLKGTLHAFRGEGDPATRHARHACELTPLDPMRYYYDSLCASAEASAGHYDAAVRLAQRSLQANAMHASSLRILTIAHAMQDQIEQARAAARKVLELEPGFTVSRFLQRSPSGEFPIGRTYAQALQRAGIPP